VKRIKHKYNIHYILSSVNNESAGTP